MERFNRTARSCALTLITLLFAPVYARSYWCPSDSPTPCARLVNAWEISLVNYQGNGVDSAVPFFWHDKTLYALEFPGINFWSEKGIPPPPPDVESRAEVGQRSGTSLMALGGGEIGPYATMHRPEETVFDWDGVPYPYRNGPWPQSAFKYGNQWYAFLHTEPDAAAYCSGLKLGSGRGLPGQALSRLDLVDGVWRLSNPKIIISARRIPLATATQDLLRCDTADRYFVGGDGDGTAIIVDDEQRPGLSNDDHVYFYHTVYYADSRSQGVSVSRMKLADLNSPVIEQAGLVVSSKIQRWSWNEDYSQKQWGPLDCGVPTASCTPRPAPITSAFQNPQDFHAPCTKNSCSRYWWGPTVSWNPHLNQYVMLLVKGYGNEWATEDVYIAYSRNAADPGSWSVPVRLTGADGSSSIADIYTTAVKENTAADDAALTERGVLTDKNNRLFLPELSQIFDQETQGFPWKAQLTSTQPRETIWG